MCVGVLLIPVKYNKKPLTSTLKMDLHYLTCITLPLNLTEKYYKTNKKTNS